MTVTPKTIIERAIGVGALILVDRSARLMFNAYWVDVILTQVLIVGIAAASLIFLAAYGGMISLAQTALMGTAGFMIGNMVTTKVPVGSPKGSRSAGTRPSRSSSRSLGTTLLGLFFGALAARSIGHLLPDDHAHLLGDRLLLRGPGHGRLGLLRHRGDQPVHPARSSATSSTTATGCTTSRWCRDRGYLADPLPGAHAFRLSLQGLRDEHVRMSSLGYPVPVHRMLAFGFSAFLAALAGVLLVWWQGQIAPGDIGLERPSTC